MHVEALHTVDEAIMSRQFVLDWNSERNSDDAEAPPRKEWIRIALAGLTEMGQVHVWCMLIVSNR